METRRSPGDGDGRSAGRPATRRRFLLATGLAVASGGVAGCTGRPTGVVGDLTAGDEEPVSVLAAGSLQRPFEEGLRDAVPVPLRIEAHGSVTAARLLASGDRDPDVVALADTTLFERVLDAPWYAEFATNALTVAHGDSPGGRRVAEAERWFDPVLRGDTSLGRTDPDLDPLGYRTWFALGLAEDHYGRPGLRERLLASSRVYPETALLSRLETGNADAAVVYRSMAADRGFASVDLPDAIDLGDPARSQDYATASYELPDGTVVRGAPVSYAVRARSREDRVRRVYEALVGGAYLSDHGFETPGSFPRTRGAVPAAFEV